MISFVCYSFVSFPMSPTTAQRLNSTFYIGWKFFESDGETRRKLSCLKFVESVATVGYITHPGDNNVDRSILLTRTDRRGFTTFSLFLVLFIISLFIKYLFFPSP